MAKYLDSTGLTHLWAKIKSYVATYITNLNLGGTYVAKEDGKGLSTNDYTTAEKDKLAGIASGAEVNVQSDWNATSGDAMIKNKPTLATVATSGSYDDLSNKPSIPDDSDLVHKTGNETISGDKSFEGNTHFHGKATGEVYFDNDTYSDSKIRLKDGGNEGWVQIVKGSGTTATTLQAALDAKQDSITSTSKLSADLISDGTTNKAYTATEKTKLSGIASGAEVNQNAFSNIKVGTTTIAADTKTDTLTIAGGGDVNVTPDAANDKLTISVTTPKKTSELTNDSGFLTEFTESDPTVPAWAKAASKPSYTASEVGAVATSAVGAASGVCPLDANQKVPAANLPSYVDDVIESYARSGQTALSQNWLATGSASGTVITPESGKIYVLMADSGDYAANTQFRWGGTAYVKLNDGGVSAITNAEIDSITSN